jgi:hypothetical protein
VAIEDGHVRAGRPVGDVPDFVRVRPFSLFRDSLIFILSACLGDVSVGGSGGGPLRALLSAPQAA